IVPAAIRSGFVPDIPAEDAVIFGEGAYDSLHVLFEPQILARVIQRLRARTLDPPGVMHAGNGSMLRAQFRQRIPAGIEKYEQWANVRNGSMRLRKPGASCCHSRSWRKTRMVFMPMASAQPSSLSICAGSKVDSCHISNSLIADLGT